MLKFSSDLLPLFAYINADLALLLRVAQSRHGGNSTLRAGFFASIRESGIFATDPDVGFEVDDTKSLSLFYELLLGILRVVNAVVLSQSVENEQAIYHARQFLQEYRPTMVSLFKRNAGIGTNGVENGPVLNELVDNFTALVVASDFMEVSEPQRVTQ